MELLQAWEQGLGLTPVDRALALLGAACSDCPQQDPAQLSLGERDASLLTLREMTLGPDIRALAHCPSCGQALELHFQVSDVRVDSGMLPQLPLTLADGDYGVKFRLPNSGDLRGVNAANKGAGEALQQLLRCCVLEARCRGKEIQAEQLPESVVTAVSERMAEADPQAEVELSVDCSDCQHQWQECFDIESFFWAEIQVRAGLMLREVHQLASAYGWSEAEIMAMSPLRRNLYLNLIAE